MHKSLKGALAQLVERNNGIVEVIGSNPLRSIPLFPVNKVFIEYSYLVIKRLQ